MRWLEAGGRRAPMMHLSGKRLKRWCEPLCSIADSRWLLATCHASRRRRLEQSFRGKTLPRSAQKHTRIAPNVHRGLTTMCISRVYFQELRRLVWWPTCCAIRQGNPALTTLAGPDKQMQRQLYTTLTSSSLDMIPSLPCLLEVHEFEGADHGSVGH